MRNPLQNPSIALSVGHTPFDGSHPGAEANGLNEYELGRQILPELVKEFYARNYDIHIIHGSLSDRIKQINKLVLNAAIEIHFNAYQDSRARGCETLHGEREGSKRLAGCVQSNLIKALRAYTWQSDKENWKNRKIKPGYNWNTPEPNDMVAYLEHVECPAVIVEPGFLTSPIDAARLKDVDRDIYGRIAEGIFEGVQRFLV
jgi:N-acetylmuramoyl-L-alanine amidase